MKICLNKELYTNVHKSLNVAAKSQKYSVSINRQIDKLWVYSYNGTVGSNNEEQTTNNIDSFQKRYAEKRVLTL